MTDNGNNTGGGGNVEMNRNRDRNGDLNEYHNDFPMLMMQSAHLILKRSPSAPIGSGSGDNGEMSAILKFLTFVNLTNKSRSVMFCQVRKYSSRLDKITLNVNSKL